MDSHTVTTQHLADLTHLGRQPGTILQRRNCLRRLERHLACDLLDATADELYAFVSCVDLAPETRAARVSHTRGFYSWCARRGHIEVDPSIDLVRPRRPRRLPNPMPEADLHRAIAVAPSPIREWLFLGAFAGLRCCEIAGLRGEDRWGNLLIVRHQKGGDEGSVPVSDTLACALATLPRQGWWFERWDGVGGSIGANMLQQHGNQYLRSLGIAHTMHSLRHRFGTMIYRACRDLRVTQELMRHKNIESTVLYTLLDPGDRLDVVELLPA